MSTLVLRQIELVKKFDDEMIYWLDGVVGKMHVGGVGAALDTFRRGREANRPPCVTLEPCRNGRLMLGLVVSRPKNGKFVYDKVLGRWDFSAPIRRGGALNESKPRHRRVATWGLQLLRALVDFGQKVRSGKVQVEQLISPRVLIPFNSGEEKLDKTQQFVPADALIDYQSMPGKTLVDARLADKRAAARAIDDDSALEDFRPVLGQKVANPFRYVAKNFTVPESGKTVSFATLCDRDPEIMSVARQFIGRALESGATDDDIVAAAAAPQQDMTLSRFSKVQVVSTESLTTLPEPYGGQMLPQPNWREQKTNEFAASL